MYDNHTHSVENRIVSVSQPFVRPIVRGKVGKPVEFGMKLDISVTDGWTRLEYRSFDAYNEATKLQEMIENFHKREGHYPSRVLADKIYRNRENLSYCKARGIRLSGPALGRPKKGEDRNKAQDYRDECERVEVERKFSLGKRKCGMGLVTAKLEETAAHVVALSILLLNLRKIQCAFLQFLDWLLGLLQSREKRMVIQWTLYNAKREKSGITMCRGEIIPKGLYHLSVSVWIVNQQGQYLLSQRHPKKQYPLYWECTGGSVFSGETSLQGAIREVKEELGILLTPGSEKLIYQTRRENVQDFYDVWLFHRDIKIEEMRLQETEVVDVQWVSSDKLFEMFRLKQLHPLITYVDQLIG